MSSTNEIGIDDITPLPVDDAEKLTGRITDQIRTAVIADSDFLELLLTSVLSRGHVHLEDVPGTGKTVAAQVLAQALGVEFNRVQFTPDLLPADITGSHVYNENKKEFTFQEGPIFANVVLADEINRAPPKTQAALLEAMGEGQVSIEGTTYELPKPFFVIATQNPIDQQGTFELPEAQRDRFAVKTSMGYPERSGEFELLERRENRRKKIPTVSPVTDSKTLRQIQVTAEGITVSEEIKQYIIDLARQTRTHDDVKTGVSPRGIQKLFETARGAAIVNGRDYVAPEDVKTLAKPVYSHRLVLTQEALVQDRDAESIIESVMGEVKVPGATGKPV